MHVTTPTVTAVFEERHGPLGSMRGSLRLRILSGLLILRAPATLASATAYRA